MSGMAWTVASGKIEWSRAVRPWPLVMFELAGLLAFLLVAVVFVLERPDADQNIPALDGKTLAVGPGQERWTGIFFQDQPVGFSVTRNSPVQDGGVLYEQRAAFQLMTFGKLQEVVTAGAALTDSAGGLVQFDFFMASGDVHLVARGRVEEAADAGAVVVMEVEQAGETSQLEFPVARAPHVGLSLESRIGQEELLVGRSFVVPYFDPVTLSEGQMTLNVVGIEVLDGGEEVFWLESEFAGVTTRTLVTPSGQMLKQVGGTGLSMVRMSEEEVKALSNDVEPVDLIAMSAVPLQGAMPDSENLTRLVLRVHGDARDRVPHDPPYQIIGTTDLGDEALPTVTRVMPDISQLPQLPRVDPETAQQPEAEWLQSTMTIPAAHPQIRTKAEELVAGAPDRLTAARRILDFVFEYVEKVPTIGVPHGLEVLRRGQGDCNEHTALFVSLARAAGIPARIAAGLVYSNRVSERGAFYYHAWPEVWLGRESEDWVAVDPTFGQFPADASHIKLVEGDLERQVEIMGVMGRLGFVLVEAEQ